MMQALSLSGPNWISIEVVSLPFPLWLPNHQKNSFSEVKSSTDCLLLEVVTLLCTKWMHLSKECAQSWLNLGGDVGGGGGGIGPPGLAVAPSRFIPKMEQSNWSQSGIIKKINIQWHHNKILLSTIFKIPWAAAITVQLEITPSASCTFFKCSVSIFSPNRRGLPYFLTGNLSSPLSWPINLSFMILSR